MTSDRSRAVSKYASLIDEFIAGKISAAAFETSYLSAIKAEQHIFGRDVFSILQELFEDVDAYVPYPDLRTEPEDLDEDQLLTCAVRARSALKQLGFN